MQARQLKEMIDSREATLGVVGLGYVGLPLAVEVARAGFKVIGLDRDEERCKELNSHGQPQGHDEQGQLEELISRGQLTITDDPDALGNCDVITVCVPTPLSSAREPDLSFVRDAAEKVAAAIADQPGSPKLVILESTSYPGTTEEVVLPILASQATIHEDFWLAFSPERIDPGNAGWHIGNTPKLVGGECETCCELAAAFYRQFISQVITMSSPRAAEMAKLLENIFRAVNIALVNELWMLCDRMGLDVWEVIGAASTKPFGYMTFWPGPGLGGHCIPVDPFYLSWKAREYDFPTEFIELAGKINVNMAYFVMDKVVAALNHGGKSIKDSRILVMGVAYKANVGDTRETPASKVMSLLLDKGALLSYHDPFVPTFEIGNVELKSVDLSPAMLATMDCLLILTAHSGVDYGMIREAGIPVVDTRNAIENFLKTNTSNKTTDNH